MKRFFLGVFFCFFGASVLLAGWKAYETEHYLLYYPESYQEFAKESLFYLESHRDRVVTLSGSDSPKKLHVVLQDLGMNTNGYANTLRNKISLFTPAPSSKVGALFSGNWLETVAVHEQFHSHQFHNLSTANRVNTMVIGNWLPYQHALGAQLAEGFAVYQESQLGRYQGRLNDGLYESMLVTKAKEGQLTSYVGSGYFHRQFPLGHWYTYGAGFVEYLAKRYGEESVSDLITGAGELQSGFFGLFPVGGLNRVSRSVFDKTLPELYDDYVLKLEKQAKTWTLSRTEAVSRGDLYTLPLVDEGIVYTIKSEYSFTAPYSVRAVNSIVSYDPLREVEEVLYSFFGTPIQQGLVKKENKLYFAVTEPRLGYANIDNRKWGESVGIYAFDLNSSLVERVYQGDISAFTFDSDGQLLIAKQLRAEHGTEIVSRSGGAIQSRTRLPVYVTSMHASDKGIIAVAQHPEGSSNIYSMDTESYALSPMIATPYREFAVTVVGDWLYYTANYKQRYRSYRKNLVTQRVERLDGPDFMAYAVPINSNELGQGEVVYVGLDSESFTLHKRSIIPRVYSLTLSESIDPVKESDSYKTLASTVKEATVWKEAAKSAVPYLRLPLLSHDGNDWYVGAAFVGGDALGVVDYGGLFIGESSLFWMETKALSPLKLSYFKVSSSNSVAVSMPMYRSSMGLIEELGLSVATDFESVQPGGYGRLRRGNMALSGSGSLKLASESGMFAEMEGVLYGKRSQLRSAFRGSVDMDHRVPTRWGGGRIYSDASGFSLMVEHTHRLLAIGGGFWNLSFFVGDVYGAAFVEYLDLFESELLYGYEFQFESGVASHFSFVPVLGLYNGDESLAYFGFKRTL